MNSGQACRLCRGSCSPIPGRGGFGDLLGDEIVVSPRVTINLLEVVEMVQTAWAMHYLIGDRPEPKGDPVLMRGDNFAAVTWVNQCGGARHKRAGLMMRVLGRLEIQGGWRYDIPGVQNTLADGISRWARSELADRVRQLTNTDDWSKQLIGARGERLCEMVLQRKNIAPRHDSMSWEIITASDKPGARAMIPRSHALYLSALGGVSCARILGITHKVYLGKWNK